MNNLTANINSYNTGIHIIDCGGPQALLLFGKTSNIYYEGIVISYFLNGKIFSFSRQENSYRIKVYGQ